MRGRRIEVREGGERGEAEKEVRGRRSEGR